MSELLLPYSGRIEGKMAEHKIALTSDQICLVLLTVTLRLYISQYLLPFTMDGLDRNGLQFEEIGQCFQVLPVFFREKLKTDL